MTNLFLLAAGGVGDIAKAAYVINEHPDETATVIGFILGLLIVAVIYALIAGVVGAIGAVVARFVLGFDKEGTFYTFVTVGGAVFGVLMLLHFLL